MVVDRPCPPDHLAAYLNELPVPVDVPLTGDCVLGPLTFRLFMFSTPSISEVFRIALSLPKT